MQVLEGIKVVDCSLMVMGPLAAAMLGDLGAEVIKIENPAGGDPSRAIATASGIPCDLPGGRNYFFEICNRNKKAMTLNFNKKEGLEILHKLVSTSDIFMHNFRPGVVERHQLDYATLSKINPRLIYASTSGYGSKGPDAQLPALDMMGLARGGWMTHIGEAHHPPLFPGNPIADEVTARILAYGIVVALLARERTGTGQQVETSMLAGVMEIQSISIGAYLLRGKELSRPVRSKSRNPLWTYYCCSDDRWIALGMSQSDRYWKDFCSAIGRPELASDERFLDWKTRAQNCEELIFILDKIFATRPMREWIDIFNKKGDFLVQPVQYHSELASDPQVIANDYIQNVDHPVLGRTSMPGSAIRLNDTPRTIRSFAPELGQNTEDILQELGYSWNDIAMLRDKEVI